MSIKNAKIKYVTQYIYGLFDPETGLLRYIGITVRPRDRFENHCNEKRGTWRTNWIQGLREKGLKPVMYILERYPIDCDWETIEKGWIKIAKEAGFKLTNCTEGGDGVKNISQEVREKMSSWQIGRKLTEEHKRKIGLRSRERRHDEAWKIAMSQKMKGRKILWNDKVGIGNQKLTDDQVIEIRKLLSEKVSQYVIADMFHVHQGTISNIKRGVSYSKVAPKDFA